MPGAPDGGCDNQLARSLLLLVLQVPRLPGSASPALHHSIPPQTSPAGKGFQMRIKDTRITAVALSFERRWNIRAMLIADPAGNLLEAEPNPNGE